MFFHLSWTGFNTGDPAENVFSFKITHSEGDFSIATLELLSPYIYGLSYGPYGYISQSETPLGPVTPLFCGCIVGLPELIDGRLVSMQLVAKPLNYLAAKTAIATVLKATGPWDPVWISPDKRDNPDTALEAIPSRWHIDRITLAVTASDINEGDFSVAFDGSNVMAGSVKLGVVGTPLNTVTVAASAGWQQQYAGSIGFDLPATSNSWTGVASFTGQGLYDNWPHPGDSIGSGWEFSDATSIEVANGKAFKGGAKKVAIKGETVDDPDPLATILSRFATDTTSFMAVFPLWGFYAAVGGKYTVSRQRTENLTITVTADTQSLIADASGDNTETLSFSTQDLLTVVDGGSDSPIRDSSYRQYLPTDRGIQSQEYVIAVARCHILSRARAVAVSWETSFEEARKLSCRAEASITIPSLPGGTASGKVIEYSFGLDGESGETFGSVAIGCSIGPATPHAPYTGDPGAADYCDADYVGSDYQQFLGVTRALYGGVVLYAPLLSIPPHDHFDSTPEQVGSSFGNSHITVTGTSDEQADVLDHPYDTINEAVDALNAVFTQFNLFVDPVNNSPITVNGTSSATVLVPTTIVL